MQAAHLSGVVWLALLGQLLVDMPGGYFGPADTVTSVGWKFSAGVLGAGVVLAIASLLGKRPFYIGIPLLYAGVVGAFLPTLGTDLIVGGLVALWAFYRLISHLFRLQSPRTVLAFTRKREESNDFKHWQRWGVLPIRHLSGVAVITTLAVVGLEVSISPVAWAICLAMHGLVLVVSWRLWWFHLKSRDRVAGLLLLPLVAVLLLAVAPPTASLVALLVFQTVFLGHLYLLGSVVNDLLSHFLRRPALLVLSAFGLLIAAGTLALRFPISSATSEPISAIDALFTAASAACITGLIVLDTPTDFSTFGHVVLLLLMQAGGLGILVLSTFAMLVIAGKLGLQGERALGESMDVRSPEAALRLTRFIVLATLAIEAVGALLLFPSFLALDMSPGQAAWHAVFHSVSAFCNAGFALDSDSMTVMANHPLGLLTVGALIALGGAGFLVLATVWSWFRAGRKHSLSVQVKIVIFFTLFMNISAILWFGILEWNHALAHLEFSDRVINALFMGISLRTAGFNSVDTGELQGPTVLICLVYMYIGGAPGSTAGGIKITTLAILVAAIPAIARGEPRVILFGRTIDQAVVYRSAAIAVITLVIAFCTSIFLLATQEGTFEVLLFEAMSATGTVGLSMGATEHLTPIGKVFITAVMFIGRTGPLTIAILLTSEKKRVVRYPKASVMVG